MDFQGTYEHSLDAKNRLTIPADHRETFRRGGVVLAQGIERCVSVWLPEAYDQYVAQALEGKNPMAPETRAVERYFSMNSFRTTLDSANRVLLQTPLMEYAGLGREVTISGARRCLEIWDRAAYADMRSDLAAQIPDLTAQLGWAG